MACRDSLSLPRLQALLLNPFEDQPPASCPHDLRQARLDALDDKERSGGES